MGKFVLSVVIVSVVLRESGVWFVMYITATARVRTSGKLENTFFYFFLLFLLFYKKVKKVKKSIFKFS